MKNEQAEHPALTEQEQDIADALDAAEQPKPEVVDPGQVIGDEPGLPDAQVVDSGTGEVLKGEVEGPETPAGEPAGEAEGSDTPEGDATPQETPSEAEDDEPPEVIPPVPPDVIGTDLSPTPAASWLTVNLDDALTLGKVLAASGFFKDANTESKAVVKVLAGAELGIGPIIAMSNLFVIDGKVSIMAGLCGALIRRTPGYDFRVELHDDQNCVIAFYFTGPDGIKDLLGRSEFSWEDAEKAKLTTYYDRDKKSMQPSPNWTKYPRNMLYARALTNGARWYVPNIFGGAIYTPEELGAHLSIDSQGREAIAALPEGRTEPPARSTGRRGGKYDTDQGFGECPLHRGKFFNTVGKQTEGKPARLAHPVTNPDGSKGGWCNAIEVGTRWLAGSTCPMHKGRKFYPVREGRAHGHKWKDEDDAEKWCIAEDVLDHDQTIVRRYLSTLAGEEGDDGVRAWLAAHVPKIAVRKSNIWTLTDWHGIAQAIADVIAADGGEETTEKPTEEGGEHAEGK